jgi:hypothetical protein
MAIYRFRVSFEDNEEVYREIEIKSAQTFEDFHTAIMQSIKFDNMHDASFFISDNYWHKGEEVRLKPIAAVKEGVVIRQMNKCKMAALIDDPHQKFVYVYDPKVGWTFLVELIKIVLDDAKITYPVCAKSVGEAPKQYKKSDIVPVVAEDDDDFEDEHHEDEEAYVNAHHDEDVAVLEGEEGEEEIAETGEGETHDEEDEFDAEGLDDHAEHMSDED